MANYRSKFGFIHFFSIKIVKDVNFDLTRLKYDIVYKFRSFIISLLVLNLKLGKDAYEDIFSKKRRA